MKTAPADTAALPTSQWGEGSVAVARRTLRWRVAVLSCLLLIAATSAVFYWFPTARMYFDLQTRLTTGGHMLPNYDFYAYYAGGHNWRAGLDPYRNHPGRADALPDVRSPRISGFIYPPTFLPGYALLARLPYATARVIWLAVTLLALVGALIAGALTFRRRSLEILGVGALLLMVSNPLLYHIRQGQIDALVAGLTTVAFFLYGRARSWPAAVLLALAILMKVTPFVILVALVAYYRDWRFLLKTLTSCMVAVGVSLSAVSLHLYVEYVSKVLPEVSVGDSFFHNQSLLRGWSYFGAYTKIPSLGAYVCLVLLLFYIGERKRVRSRVMDYRAAEAYLLSVVTMLLFSPLAWRMAFVWVIVPLAVVLASPKRYGRLQYSLLLAGAGFLSSPLWDWSFLSAMNTIGGMVVGGVLAIRLLPPDAAIFGLRFAQHGANRSLPDRPAVAAELKQSVPAISVSDGHGE